MTFGSEAIKFLADLCHKFGLRNGEKRSKSFLFQATWSAVEKGHVAFIVREKRIKGKLEELAYL